MRATAGSARPSDDIVLVTIDEESIRGLEPLVGRWPWPRLVHAEVLNYLARAQPRVVLYDVLFTEHDRSKFFVQDEEWSGKASDGALAASARAVPLVLPGDAVPEALRGGRGAGLPRSPARDSGCRCRTPSNGRCSCRRSRQSPPRPVRSRTTSRCSTPTARGAGTCRSCVIRAERFRRSRLPRQASHSAAAPDDLPTHRPDACLIDYRSRRADGSSPYRRVSFYKLFYAEQQLLEGKTPVERPESLRDKIVIVGATASALDDVFTVPVAAGKVGGLEVHAAVVDAILAAAGRGAGRDVPAPSRLTLDGGVALGRHRRLCRAVDHDRGRIGAVGRHHGVCDVAVRRGPVVSARRAAAGAGAGDVRRCGVRVLRRRPRETARQAAVLALCLEGRLRPADRGPRRRAARRRAPDDDRALLRHPRVHDGVRAGRAGSHRRAAQRVLLTDGAHRLRAQGHHRQVRRRHDHGALRRAARRPGSRRPRRPDGAGDVGRSGAAEPRVGRGRPSHARHRHRHQHRRDGRRQPRLGSHHELHRDRRPGEPWRPARVAEQGLPHARDHQRGHEGRAEGAL